MNNEDNGWQPIETAPKDIHVLVWGESLRWRGNEGRAMGYFHSDYNGRKNSVVTVDGVCGGPNFKKDITHWQPLPSPPTTKGTHHE